MPAVMERPQQPITARRRVLEKDLLELISLDCELATRKYYHFFKCSWDIINPTTPLLSNWHHELIAEYLTACYNRQINRLIINIPPRYAKSTLVSVSFPAWVWLHRPEERFMFASYSESLSTKHSTDRRTIIESSWYQSQWGCKCEGKEHRPDCKAYRMASDQNVKTEFQNDRRGHMIATSMTGTATGKGGNIIVIDDPHDPKRAESKTLREGAIEAFDKTFTTRLDDKVNGVIIIVMQRLHPNDLSGHLLAQGGWEHLLIPGIEAKPKTYIFPISGKAMQRQEGQVLHQEREDQATIDKQKTALGSYGFAGQYQQEPSPREGGIFKRHYWQRYNHLPTKVIENGGISQEVLDFDEIVDFWDMNFKEGSENDNVCGAAWGRKGADKYLLHLNQRQMGFNSTLKAVKSFRGLYKEIRRTVVEDKANGPAIIQVLKSEISGLKAFNPRGSKEERAAVCEPQLESGNVYLPTTDIATFDVEAYIDNLAAFPNVEHDDDVDVTTMALIYFKGKELHGQQIRY